MGVFSRTKIFTALFLSVIFSGAGAARVPQEVPNVGGTWEFLQWHQTEADPGRMILTQNGTRLTGRVSTSEGVSYDVLGTVDGAGQLSLKRLMPFREFQEGGSSIEVVRAIAAEIGNAGRNGFVAASINLTFEKDLELLKGSRAEIAWEYEGNRLVSAVEKLRDHLFFIRPARPSGDDYPRVGGTWKFRRSDTTLDLTQEGTDLKGKFVKPDGQIWETEGKLYRKGVLELVRYVSRREFSRVDASAVDEVLRKRGDPTKPGYFRMTVYLKLNREGTGLKGYYGGARIIAENGKVKESYEEYDTLDLVIGERELLDSFISPGIADPFDIPDDLTP